MNQKYRDLLQYLYDCSENITASALADALKVSSRSIKTYIASINKEYGDIILSSRNGYQADRKKISSLLDNEKDRMFADLPQNYEQRSHFLIKSLMEKNNLDLEDLGDEIFVSVQTLINDIKKMNTQFEQYKVSFVLNKGILSLEGKESGKRKMISRIIRDEAKNSVFDMDFLKQQFAEYDVIKIADNIKAIFNENGFYLNEFNYANLILHILIILSRNDYDKDAITVELDEKILEMTNEIVQMLEKECDITLGESSKTQLAVLLSCNSINPEALFEPGMIEDDNKISEFVKDILKQIQDDYGVDLTHDIFKYPFTLHLTNLYHRLNNDLLVDNPLGDGIRKNCPTIYEIALEVAFEIKNKWGFDLDESEIGFIALHIGGEIQRQQQDEAKQPIALVIKDYHGLREWIYNQVMMNFGSRAKISGFYDQLSDVPDKSMVIITLQSKVDLSAYPNAITVNAFSQLPNLGITELLDKADNRKKLKILYDTFNGIFKESLFVVDESEKYDAALWKMSKMLMNEGYVDDKFYRKVLEREQASSTAFGRIAIPHSTKFDGLKTAICVLVSPEGIEWKDNKVNIIFLVSVNKADSTYFRDVFGALIQLFEEDEIIEELIQCKNFEQFKKVIYDHKMI